MPFQIVQKGKGYVVENKETGKQYSKRPLTKQVAMKQLTLLLLIEKGILKK
jgi:hypothetical protein